MSNMEATRLSVLSTSLVIRECHENIRRRFEKLNSDPEIFKILIRKDPDTIIEIVEALLDVGDIATRTLDTMLETNLTLMDTIDTIAPRL